MQTGIVRVTDKGQISIPVKIQKASNIKKGDELFMISKDNKIIIEKVSEEKFRDLLKHSESVAKKLWSSPQDDIWDSV